MLNAGGFDVFSVCTTRPSCVLGRQRTKRLSPPKIIEHCTRLWFWLCGAGKTALCGACSSVGGDTNDMFTAAFYASLFSYILFKIASWGRRHFSSQTQGVSPSLATRSPTRLQVLGTAKGALPQAFAVCLAAQYRRRHRLYFCILVC